MFCPTTQSIKAPELLLAFDDVALIGLNASYMEIAFWTIP